MVFTQAYGARGLLYTRFWVGTGPETHGQKEDKELEKANDEQGVLGDWQRAPVADDDPQAISIYFPILCLSFCGIAL